MVQCKTCQVSLARVKPENVITCTSGCGCTYHKKCAGKIKHFVESGLCEQCRKETNDDDSHKSTSDNTPIIVDSAKVTPEKLLLEVNQKLEIVYKMKTTLETMAADISFYAEKYQQLIEEKKKSDKKIKSLEESKAHLEIKTKALEERISYLETCEKDKNIEICGMEEEKDENLEVKVKKLASKLGINTSHIFEYKRVGESKPNKGADEGRKDRVRPVVVVLATRAVRDQWLATRKTNQLTNDDVFSSGNKSRIYINEDLTKYTRNLLWTVKNELKTEYKYIWVQNGRVLIRKDDPNDNKIKVIRSLDDVGRYTA
ncbi:hypothetical protein NE865_01263 [Phthorimaea operculella]|nr:hypothetical protein NE865_01263 [Phthorimaea operculella]